ncbi:hypothetical protein AVEN_34356-1 [Araneus ventricosus]|uniref:Uncharacterized protein n=1 Tax=Araneus ventricosus TaxID=182803 RepID=A0A4Y2G5H7_ARAVE|nr:hypothetical protein AVEN_34356-1 [Araneus ventricosus]
MKSNDGVRNQIPLSSIYRWSEQKFTLICRSEGTIDRTKTAEKIVRDENVDIKTRFQIACIYCLEDSVQSLWTTLDVNSETEEYETPFNTRVNGMVHLWVYWMSEGPRYPFGLLAREDCALKCLLLRSNGSVPKFYPLIRSLSPEHRREYFKYLSLSDVDDFRSCLYHVTNEEQKEIMKLHARRVLLIHMEWPLACVFLDVAEKMWEFLSYSSFTHVLELLVFAKNKADFDYEHLTAEFWKRCPDDFRKNAGGFVYFSSTLKFIEDMKEKETLQ